MIHYLGKICIIEIKCSGVYNNEAIFSYKCFLHDADDVRISVFDGMQQG